MKGSDSLTKQVTILIGADLAPRKTNYTLFSEGLTDQLVSEKLLTRLRSADYRIFNLESPLTDNLSPISKDGPGLAAPASSIRGIKQLDPSILGLANNHIMDQGEQGLFDTMNILTENEILFTGAGRDPEHAAKPIIIDRNGIKTGIYACTEHEFSIAEEGRAGANPFDPLESPDHIARLKSECDYVIVLYHGGREYYRYPSPELRKVCRKMAEKGADLILCQHSHCIGSYEKYENTVIVYGQGNFLFDGKDNEFRNSSLLVEVKLGKELMVDFIPLSKKGAGVEMASPEMAGFIMEGFINRSEQISIPGFVEEQYVKHCIGNGQYFMATCAGFGKTLRRIDKLLNGLFTRFIYTRKKRDVLRNNIQCEAHRELILKYLRILEKKRKK